MTSLLRMAWLKGPAWMWLGVIAVLVGGAVTAGVKLSGSGPFHDVASQQPAAAPTPAPTTSVLGMQYSASSSTTGNGNGGVGNGNGNGNVSNPGHPITVTGDSPTGLVPGVPTTINVTVTNANNQPITVTNASITVTDASTSCTAAKNIATTSYDSSAKGAIRYVAPANGSVKVPLKITLLDLKTTNQDKCTNATFPLTFNATGVQS